MNQLRLSIAQVLESSGEGLKLGRFIDALLILLIIGNVVAIVLESVEEVAASYTHLFLAIEIFSVAIFTVEYLLRLWVCVDKEHYRDLPIPNWRKRIRYLRSPLAIIDLMAILPTYLMLFVSFDLRFLRVFRLLRVFKLTRYSRAMQLLLQSIREEKGPLLAAFFIMSVALITASCGIYLIEHDEQPDKFGSIPDAMWWAMATLTTVGYGDVVPITPLGRFFGGVITVLSMGMVAIPTGLLASSFSDQLRRRRVQFAQYVALCSRDGDICEKDQIQIEEMRIELGLSKKEAERAIKRKMNEIKHINYCANCGHKIP